jgi:MoxR-like ATPase
MNEPNFLDQHRIFLGNRKPHERIASHGEAPPWRTFHQEGAPIASVAKGAGYYAREEEIRAVNLALYLRRPLLVTGDPGTGKSTLAYAIAHELGLDEVLVWPITSRSNLQQGLYQYDAVGRLQEASLQRQQQGGKEGKADPAEIGRFIRLGPLGTALYLSQPKRPAVLLIDELDKSDIDLPNDLLHTFEEGEFEIPELQRLPEDCLKVPVWLHRRSGEAEIERGRVLCKGFPIVILTNNGERDFSPAFLRRCIRLDVKAPTPAELAVIVRQRLQLSDGELSPDVKKLIALFVADREDPARQLATDQLLNAVYLVSKGAGTVDLERLRETVFRPLTNAPVERKEAVRT